MIGQYKTNLLYLWAIFFSQEQPVYWMTELMTKLKTKLEMHEYLFILPYYLHWTFCAMLEKYKTMHCFCFLALTLSNIWCPCLKSLCIEARYKGTEGFFSAFLDWGWKVLLFKMVYRRKVSSDPQPHQPFSHFIVHMLTQCLNQKKKCEKWKRFSIEGLGVKFSPKSGCQVLLSKNIELQPSRLTTQTSVAKRGKI